MLSTTYDLSALPDPQIDQQFYAGTPYKRLLVWVIDMIVILLIVTTCILLTFGFGLFFYPMLLFVGHIVYWVFTLSRNSATLGMALLGIEIRNSHGDKLTPPEAAWLHGLFTALVIPVFPLIISIIMMLVNTRGQSIQDYVLGMAAINKPDLS